MIQESYGPKPQIPVRIAPFIMVIVAATMIGASSAVLIADRDAFPLVQRSIDLQLAKIRSYLLARDETAGAKPETTTVIRTGLSSIVAIDYSSTPDSAQVAFDLEAMDVVRSGRLRSPDRIYFDLQDRSRGQGASRQAQSQKTVSIAGNLLTRVRIAQSKPGTTRIVLDLKRYCNFMYKASPGPPSRLIVEIRPRETGASSTE